VPLRGHGTDLPPARHAQPGWYKTENGSSQELTWEYLACVVLPLSPKMRVPPAKSAKPHLLLATYKPPTVYIEFRNTLLWGKNFPDVTFSNCPDCSSTIRSYLRKLVASKSFLLFCSRWHFDRERAQRRNAGGKRANCLGSSIRKDLFMSNAYDAIVVGTGQAGAPLAGRLSEAGMKVAIVERKLFGGTCVNTGCTPTKTMVASAYAAHLARRAPDFGVVINGQVGVDMKKVKARKDAVSGQSQKSVESWLKQLQNCTVYQGHARFTSPTEMSVGTTLLTATHIFINVGGRAQTPPMPGLDQVKYLTNSSIMDVDFLPRHLVVIGGSYVGLEFGQIYRRFGSEVTIVEMKSRLIDREDEDVSTAVSEILEREGINLRLNAKCLTVRKQGNELVVTLDCTNGSPEVNGSHLLLAVGRRPNTDDLGLDKAGVSVDQRGYIQVDDELRTNVPGIWAMGDCNGKGAFTHTAYNDYEIVAANILDKDPRRVSDRIPAYALYIDPPLGRVGMTETEVRSTGKPALVGKRPMAKVNRAIEKGETQGFMKIVVDADTKQILGAAILGTGGDEVVHSILDLMYAKAPYTVMQRAVHIHPTVSELIPTMLGELRPLASI
jgi:pyruvate/2-oxoglutarate dehydrogenase complex dihydrolipoamide dehydrogenase (E3) component